MPFGGRHAELDDLDSWLATPGTSARRLLVAPAGRGKSALLVRWIERLRTKGRIGDGEDAWRLVFVPISMRFDTNRPEVFLEALATQLAHAADDDLRQSLGDPIAYYTDHSRRLCDQLVDQSRSTLIVIDGADEALGGNFMVDWYPRRPGSKLKILISARELIGDDGAAGWARRLGWHSSVRVDHGSLDLLSIDGVRDVLERTGAPLDLLAAQPAIIRELHERAQGEPLLLRLYAEDLWSEREDVAQLSVEHIKQIHPGFEGYFRDLIERQKRAWRDERGDLSGINEGQTLEHLFQHLAVLACAYGPLTKAELVELTQRAYGTAPGFDVESALYPVRRFVIGTGRSDTGRGYVLSHPKLGEFLRDYIDPSYIAAAMQSYPSWGMAIIDRLERGEIPYENTPPYCLQYLADHLIEVKAPISNFMRLVDESWFRSWQAFGRGYHGFARDIRKVAKVLRSNSDQNPSSWALLIRCQLVLSSITSSGAQIPGALLVACVKHGIVTGKEALYLAEQQDKELLAASLAQLLPVIPDWLVMDALGVASGLTGDHPAAADAIVSRVLMATGQVRLFVVLEAMAVVKRIAKGRAAARAISRLISALAPEDQLTQLGPTLTWARETESHDRELPLLFQLPKFRIRECAGALAELASGIPTFASAPEEALTAALEAIRHPICRLEAVSAIILSLPAEDQAALLRQALQFAQEYEVELAASGWTSSTPYTSSYAVLAGALAGKPDLVVETLRLVKNTSDAHRRAEALAALLPYLGTQAQAEVLTEVVNLALPKNGYPDNDLLSQLSKHPTALIERAKTLKGAGRRVGALNALIPTLAATRDPGALEQALTLARTIRSSHDRAEIFVQLLSMLDDEAQVSTAAEFLSADPTALLSEISSTYPETQRACRGVIEKTLRAYPNLFDEAARGARRIPYEQNRTWALASLLGSAPTAQRIEIIKEILISINLPDVDRSAAVVLSMLVPFLQGTQRTKALAGIADALRDISHARQDDVRDEAAIIIENLSSESDVIASLYLACSQIADDAQKATFLAKVAQALSTDQEQPNLIKSSLILARRAETKTKREWKTLSAGSRGSAFAILAPLLTKHPTLLQDALRLARSIPSPNGRAEALAALAPLLTGALRGDVLLETIEAAAHEPPENSLEGAGSGILWLVRRLGGALAENPTVRDGLLASINRLRDDVRRFEILKELAFGLPPEERWPLLGEAIRVARAILDARERADALASIAPALDSHPDGAAMATQVHRDQTSALDEAITLARGAVTGARGTEDSERRVESLLAIAETLSVSEREPLLREALTALRSTTRLAFNGEYIFARLGRLLGGQSRELLSEVLKIGADYPKMIAFLAPELVSQPAVLYAETLHAMRMPDLETFGRLFSHLPRGIRNEVLTTMYQDYLAAVTPEQHELFPGKEKIKASHAWFPGVAPWHIARLLIELAPTFVDDPDTLKGDQDLLGELVHIARNTLFGKECAVVLAALARAALPEDQPAILREATSAAMTVGDTWERAQALSAVDSASCAIGLSAEHRIETARNLLDAIGAIERPDAFWFDNLTRHMALESDAMALSEFEAMALRVLVNQLERLPRGSALQLLSGWPLRAIARREGAPALRELWRTIEDVSRWFP